MNSDNFLDQFSSFEEAVEAINKLPPMTDEQFQQFLDKVQAEKADTEEAIRMKKAVQWHKNNTLNSSD